MNAIFRNCVFLLALFQAVAAANAGPLAGHVLEAKVIFDGTEFSPAQNTVDFVVDPSFPINVIELPTYAFGTISIDFRDTGPTTASIFLTSIQSQHYLASPDGKNLLLISALSSSTPKFLAAGIGQASTVFNDQNRIHFGANFLSYNLNDLNVAAGDSLRIDLTTAVPEPAASMLFTIGLIAVAYQFGRKTAKAADGSSNRINSEYSAA